MLIDEEKEMSRIRGLTLAGLLVCGGVGATACSSGATNARGGAADNTPAALANGPPADILETPASGTLTETGGSALSPLLQRWAAGFHARWPMAVVQPAARQTSRALAGVAAGSTDIAASGLSLRAREMRAHPGLESVPLAVSAGVVVYNVPGVSGHLKLNGVVLSAMYEGSVATWNASAIARLNPGTPLPDLPVVTLHRANESASTWLFTKYLTESDPRGWGTRVGAHARVQWPMAPHAGAENSAAQMISACKATPGCVAYLGIPSLRKAVAANLDDAALGDAGNDYVLPTVSAIAAEAAGRAHKTAATGTASLVDSSAGHGYPLVGYEYGIVKLLQPSSGTARSVRALLEWLVSKHGGSERSLLSQAGLQPLSEHLERRALSQTLEIR